MWSNYLDSKGGKLPRRAIPAAVAMLKVWNDAESAGQGRNGAAALAKVARFVGEDNDEAFATDIDAPARVLTEVPIVRVPRPLGWWQDDARAESQGRVHAALLGMRVGPKTDSLVSELVVTDLERALSSPPALQALRAVREVAGSLERTNAERLAKSLKAVTADPATLGPLGLTRIALAKAIEAKGGAPLDPAWAIEPAEAIALLGTSDRQEVLERWFELGPSLAAARDVALNLGPAPREREMRPVAAWAKSLSPQDRTDLLLAITGLANDTSDWMGTLAQEPIEEERLVAPLLGRIEKASRGDERKEIAKTVAAVHAADAHVVREEIKAIKAILDPGRRNYDRTAAVVLARALRGRRHTAGRELADLFEQAGREGLELNGRARDDLADAGIRVRKPDLGNSIRNAFGSRRRR
jgi:hypothetical protein